MNKIAIVIPVFNEAGRIQPLVEQLKTRMDKPCEILLVDGGSSDGSWLEMNAIEGVIALRSERGRAIQMNAGAAASAADLLYFLHCDTLPPKSFDRFIRDSVSRGSDAGCFRLKFNSTHPWLKLAGWLTALRWQICRGGDQSLFIKRAVFEKLEGFDTQYRIYEDMDMIRKLYKAFRFDLIPHDVITSARRYEEYGVFRLQFHFWMIHLMARFGADPDRLYRYYLRHID